jgi:hypothetical protein
MGQFDQAARYTAKLDPSAFLRWLLGLNAPLAFQGWLDTRTLPFPGEPDRTCDTVAELLDATHPGRLWALVVEIQSEPDAEILDRLLEYMIRLRREVRHGPDRRVQYDTAAALLNLTGPPPRDVQDMVLPCQAEVRLRFRPLVRTLRDDDATAALRGIDAGSVGRSILPWIPLMHGGGDLSTMEEWKRLAGLEPESRLRSVYGSLALVFAELADRKAEWKKALEGWNMRESTVVAEWQAEGRTEGRAEGLVQARRADLMDILQTRFHTTLAPDLAAAIQEKTDPTLLSRWVILAATVDSLDVFRAAIQEQAAANGSGPEHA